MLALQVVSYAKFLYPTNALVAHKADSHGPLPPPRPSVPRTLPGSRHKPAAPKSAPAGTELGALTGRKGQGWAATHSSEAPDQKQSKESHWSSQSSVQTERGLQHGVGVQPLRGEGAHSIAAAQATQRTEAVSTGSSEGEAGICPHQDRLPFHPWPGAPPRPGSVVPQPLDDAFAPLPTEQQAGSAEARAGQCRDWHSGLLCACRE